MSDFPFVDVSNVVGLRFECDHCHGAVTAPIEKASVRGAAMEQAGKIALGSSCPFCNNPLGFAVASDDGKTLHKFAEYLERIIAIMSREGDNRVPLRLRLEIKS